MPHSQQNLDAKYPEKSFTGRITAQVEPKNPSAETVAAVLAQARSTIFSMGSLLNVPVPNVIKIAKEAQPIFDAIAKSADPGKESFVQFAQQNDRLLSLDGNSPSETTKHNILETVISGIRSAIGPKSVELGSPS